jgi:hypothetical protein
LLEGDFQEGLVLVGRAYWCLYVVLVIPRSHNGCLDAQLTWPPIKTHTSCCMATLSPPFPLYEIYARGCHTRRTPTFVAMGAPIWQCQHDYFYFYPTIPTTSKYSIYPRCPLNHPNLQSIPNPIKPARKNRDKYPSSQSERPFFH